MEIKDERLIPATVQATWDALNDPDVLKACIPGCESLERDGDDGFTSLVALKVGPVSARFKGRVKLTNIQAPHSYTLNFDGQGGVAGFGRGSADVELVEEGSQTRLKYNAKAQVGGKMAQMGSRLIDATVQKLTNDFFSAFEAYLTPSDGEGGAAPAEHADTVATATTTKSGTTPEKTNATSSHMTWWLVSAVAAAAVLAWAFAA